MPAQLRQSLLRDALTVDVPAGATVYDEDSEPRCGLVLAGLIRVYMTSQDGRQITVRYARPGDLLGIAAAIGGPAPTSVQIMTDARLLLLNTQTLRQLGRVAPEVGWLLAEEVTRRLYECLGALAGTTFGSLRERLSRHLLDLAATRQRGGSLMVAVTQQDLADAVGSVRPVVARILRDFRVEGLITTSSDGIVILQPEALQAAAWARDESHV
jgi:CRP/FNR family transcriptional regulator